VGYRRTALSLLPGSDRIGARGFAIFLETPQTIISHRLFFTPNTAVLASILLILPPVTFAMSFLIVNEYASFP
jgi:hypothetical protein